MRRRSTRRLTVLLALLAMLASACSVLGSSDGYAIEAEFARTYNLFPGSPVRVLGVEVGKVTDIQTSPGSKTVTVSLHIDDEVQLPQDARAVIVPAALLGERYVQIDPPYTGGPTLSPDARISIANTIVPSEFDEILESLNNFVGDLDKGEVARLVDNLAGTLDGNGEALGQTIDAARGAIGVLQDNDDQLIALASRLSDLNETIGSRDAELRRLISDFDTVMTSLSNDRGNIDAALSGLVRVSDQLATLLEEHRPDLQDDIETLTRVGRTAQRNLDQISLSILSQAELFRHATRVINRDKNWLPLVDHAEELGNSIADAVARRLIGVCLRAGIDPSQCEQLGSGGLVPTSVCLPPIVACPTEPSDDETLTIAETLRRVIEESPEMAEALREDAARRSAELSEEVPR